MSGIEMMLGFASGSRKEEWSSYLLEFIIALP